MSIAGACLVLLVVILLATLIPGKNSDPDPAPTQMPTTTWGPPVGKHFFVVLGLGLCCTAFAKALDGFNLYSVHKLS